MGNCNSSLTGNQFSAKLKIENFENCGSSCFIHIYLYYVETLPLQSFRAIIF